MVQDQSLYDLAQAAQKIALRKRRRAAQRRKTGKPSWRPARALNVCDPAAHRHKKPATRARIRHAVICRPAA